MFFTKKILLSNANNAFCGVRSWFALFSGVFFLVLGIIELKQIT